MYNLLLSTRSSLSTSFFATPLKVPKFENSLTILFLENKKKDCIKKMALSNCNKEVLTNLFQMVNSTQTEDLKLLESVKMNSSTYSQLSLITEQIKFLQKQATTILESHMLSEEASKAQCTFKKAPGNYYYLYKHDEKYILSLVSPEEGIAYDCFLCKYYCDYDFIMKPLS